MNGTIYEALAVRTDRMAKQSLRDVASLSSWKQQRPRRIEEYRQSLGLDLVGPLGVPAIRNYEEFRGRGFYCRKFAFELLPDCWGAAAIYYPDAPSPEMRRPFFTPAAIRRVVPGISRLIPFCGRDVAMSA